MIKHIFILGFFLISSSTIFADTCYLVIKNDIKSLDNKLTESVAVALIKQYVAPIEKIPLIGIGMNECVYDLSTLDSSGEINITISGEKLNSMGDSEQEGIKGYRHALLRAIYRSKDDAELRSKICSNYSTMMQGDCRSLSANVLLYDGSGNELKNMAAVYSGDQFNFMIQPNASAYAYIIGKDAHGSMFKIFPNSDVTSQENPLKAHQTYYFPASDTGFAFEFDENKGLETFYVLVSVTPMKDVDEMFNALESAKGAEREKLAKVLEQRIRTRGFGIKKKKATVNLKAGAHSKFTGSKKKLIDNIESRGAFVKIITLNHR